jgi:integrase
VEDACYFIDTMPNLKQKAMAALLYSSGLRIGEVCRLKYDDISRAKMRIHISHGKNRSDRYAILSEKALEILTEYWRAYGNPRNWLFPKMRGADKPIDTYYLSRHIAEHEKRLEWEHRITCHTFRHAFGTHMYENGACLPSRNCLATNHFRQP